MAGRSARATTPTRIWGRFGSALQNAGRVVHTRRWRRPKSRPAKNPGEKAAAGPNGLAVVAASGCYVRVKGNHLVRSAGALTATPFNRSGQKLPHRPLDCLPASLGTVASRSPLRHRGSVGTAPEWLRTTAATVWLN